MTAMPQAGSEAQTTAFASLKHACLESERLGFALLTANPQNQNIYMAYHINRYESAQ